MPKSIPLSFCEEDARACELDDSAFLARIAWSRNVPRAVVAPATGGDVQRLVDYHRGPLRQAGKSFERAARRGRSTPIAAWSRDLLENASGSQSLLTMLDDVEDLFAKAEQNGQSHQRIQELNRGLTEWLAGHERPAAAETFCLLELLANAASLLDEHVLAAAWSRTLRATIQLVWNLGSESPDDNSAGSADERLLWEGELRWRVGLMFADVKGASQVRRAGAQELRRQLLEYTDTDGTPFAALVPRLPLWIGILVRSQHWGERFGQSLWNAEAGDRFRTLIALTATLLGNDGRLALSDVPAVELLRHATNLTGFSAADPPRALVKRVRQHLNGRRSQKKVKADHRPTLQSDWALLAGLRSTWSRDADAALVAHHVAAPLLHIRCRGETLAEGPWGLHLQISGKRVGLSAEWTCTCWHSDRDVDYAELQLDVDGETRIGRQLLLWRKRRMLLLADAIVTRPTAALQYRMTLPLQASVGFEQASETREAALITAEDRVRVFPLSLPDDIVLGTPGGLNEYEGRLEYELSGRGGLYAPLVLCWDRQQQEAAADWNRLTVTESRQILDASAAGAYRLRIGRRQWLFYRRLNGSTHLQTVLGLHTGHETVIGAFPRSGEVEPDLLVESSEE